MRLEQNDFWKLCHISNTIGKIFSQGQQNVFFGVRAVGKAVHLLTEYQSYILIKT